MTRWLLWFALLLVLPACNPEDPDLLDEDGDGFTPAEGDCDDAEIRVNPVAPELCDGLDNDCDLLIDEGDDVIGAATWYLDVDGDGYGRLDQSKLGCEAPEAYVDNSDDCDDMDESIHPGADELCDGVDRDCDGVRDDEAVDAPTWYIDDDEDGYGSSDYTLASCFRPDGYREDDTDCDDLHATVHPDAAEICDGLDNDCDGVTDPDDAEDAGSWYEDLDGDGYGAEATLVVSCTAPSGSVDVARDCDDGDSEVHPDADEICDAIDNDCNDLVDLDDPGLVDSSVWYADLDGDTYGDPLVSEVACAQPSQYVADDTDCDDGNSAVHPDATEVCGDGVDNDCVAEAEGCLSGTIDLADADVKVWGDTANGSAGFALESAGDFDGDGTEDMIIGAWETDTSGTSSTGKTFIVLGPVTSGSLAGADLAFDSSSINGYSGRSVAGLGDLDGDGFDEIAIGADGKDRALDDQDLGIVYVIYGPTTGSHGVQDSDALLWGDAAGDQAGYALASAGDVDDDGVPDLGVGSYGADGAGSGAGAVTLILGPISGEQTLSEAGYTLNGESSGDDAGIAVDGAGDVDGDGYDDLVVGAPDDDDGGSDSGAVYLVLGPVTGPGDLVDAAVKLSGVNSSDHAGTSVAGVGDTDGDGYADFLVGVPDSDFGASNAGAGFLVLGPVTTSGDLSSSDAALIGENSSDDLGTRVDGVGDLNADGRDDFVVSAPYHDAGGSSSGAAYLVFGPLVGIVDAGEADLKLVGESASDVVGGAAGLGDQDGDGYRELLVGAPGDDDGGTDAGAAYVIFGGEGL